MIFGGISFMLPFMLLDYKNRNEDTKLSLPTPTYSAYECEGKYLQIALYEGSQEDRQGFPEGMPTCNKLKLKSAMMEGGPLCEKETFCEKAKPLIAIYTIASTTVDCVVTFECDGWNCGPVGKSGKIGVKNCENKERAHSECIATYCCGNGTCEVGGVNKIKKEQ